MYSMWSWLDHLISSPYLLAAMLELMDSHTSSPSDRRADNPLILEAEQISVRDTSKSYRPSPWTMFACLDALGKASRELSEVEFTQACSATFKDRHGPAVGARFPYLADSNLCCIGIYRGSQWKD